MSAEVARGTSLMRVTRGNQGVANSGARGASSEAVIATLVGHFQSEPVS